MQSVKFNLPTVAIKQVEISKGMLTLLRKALQGEVTVKDVQKAITIDYELSLSEVFQITEVIKDKIKS